jgi:hypothetical protein
MLKVSNFEAWGNFVMVSDPDDYENDNIKKAYAIAKNYMNAALGGGMNSFLTNSWETDINDVVKALETIGAPVAAKQLKHVIIAIGVPMPVMSQESRWDLLDKHWPSELNEEDYLSDEAEKDIMRELERHVNQNEAFYLALT